MKFNFWKTTKSNHVNVQEQSKQAGKNEEKKSSVVDEQRVPVEPQASEARTELVFIVDRSGSMGGLESDTIGGLNAVLQQNRNLEGQVTVSTVLFDDKTEVLHDRIAIQDVKPLTEKDYSVRGCTALLDAVGGSINHIDRVQRYMPAGHKADKVIFVITTDGMENASHRFTYDEVKKKIGQKTEQGWEFLFLGANIDVAAESARLGIAADRMVEYNCDEEGTHAMYDAVACATVGMRQSSSRFAGNWAAPVQADNARRGK